MWITVFIMMTANLLNMTVVTSTMFHITDDFIPWIWQQVQHGSCLFSIHIYLMQLQLTAQ